MDLLTRNLIAGAVATATILATMSATSGYITPKIKAQIGQNIAVKEDAINSAILSYIQKNSTNPTSIEDLISAGFLPSNFNNNGDSGTFSFLIDNVKNIISISTTFENESVLLSHLNNMKNAIKPTRDDMTLTSIYPIPTANQAFLQAYTGATPPSSSNFTKWYDTSGSEVKLKMFDTATSSWKEFSAGTTTGGGGGSGAPTNLGAEILANKAALVTESAENGDIRYVSDSSSNSIVAYTYYNGSWYGENGYNVNTAVDVGSMGECPGGFVFIPNSNATEYQIVNRGYSQVTSTKGWCIAKTEMQYFNIANKIQDTSDNTATYKYSTEMNKQDQRISSGLTNPPISFVTYNQAENLCENNIVDKNTGETIVGGALPSIKLFNLLMKDITAQNSNYSNGQLMMGCNSSKAMTISENDLNGYFLCSLQTGPSRRTLNLSSNEVIWDLGNNMTEFYLDSNKVGSTSNVSNSLVGTIFDPINYGYNGNATIGKVFTNVPASVVASNFGIDQTIFTKPTIYGTGLGSVISYFMFFYTTGYNQNQTAIHIGFRCVVPAK